MFHIKEILNICFIFRLFSKVERSAERYELWKVISDFLQYFSDVCQLSRSFNLGQVKLNLKTAFVFSIGPGGTLH